MQTERKPTLVLCRHGESLWNKENRFTGWWDVELSEKGLFEANQAGKKLKNAGFNFDLAYTSVLKRAIKTLWLALEQMDQLWIPVVKDWRLNERHYGGLTGLNKKQTAEQHGEEQVHIWRRSYDTRPPELPSDSPFCLDKDRRYCHIQGLPKTECLKDTLIRVVAYWESEILPQLKLGKNIIISAHGNSLRALMKHLSDIADDEITSLEIPTGAPLVYHFNAEFNATGYEYLS